MKLLNNLLNNCKIITNRDKNSITHREIINNLLDKKIVIFADDAISRDSVLLKMIIPQWIYLLIVNQILYIVLSLK